jgi:hypothetical protein
MRVYKHIAETLIPKLLLELCAVTTSITSTTIYHVLRDTTIRATLHNPQARSPQHIVPSRSRAELSGPKRCNLARCIEADQDQC